MPPADEFRSETLKLLDGAQQRLTDSKALLVSSPSDNWDSGMKDEALEVLQRINELHTRATRAVARFEIKKAEATIEQWKKRL